MVDQLGQTTFEPLNSNLCSVIYAWKANALPCRLKTKPSWREAGLVVAVFSSNSNSNNMGSTQKSFKGGQEGAHYCQSSCVSGKKRRKREDMTAVAHGCLLALNSRCLSLLHCSGQSVTLSKCLHSFAKPFLLRWSCVIGSSLLPLISFVGARQLNLVHLNIKQIRWDSS